MHRLGKWLSGAALVCSVELFAAGCGGGSDLDSAKNGGAAGGKSPKSMTHKDTSSAAGSKAAHSGSGGGGSMMPSSGGNAGSGGYSEWMKPGEPAMDECGLHTKYAGDEYCILPPPADKGFQLHIGPSDYDNPEPQYMLGAGRRDHRRLPGDVRQRQGHLLLLSPVPHAPRRASQHRHQRRRRRHRSRPAHRDVEQLAEDDPPGGIIAPENEDVGIPLPAHTAISVNLHSINTTREGRAARGLGQLLVRRSEPRSKSPCTRCSRSAPMGTILPGEDVVFGSSCNVSGTGRMLWVVRPSPREQRALQRRGARAAHSAT